MGRSEGKEEEELARERDTYSKDDFRSRDSPSLWGPFPSQIEKVRWKILCQAEKILFNKAQRCEKANVLK